MKYVKLYEEFVLQELEDEYNIELDLYDNGDYMTLSKLVVSPDDRKGGVGTEVMNKICQYADEIGRDIYLTPDTSYGGTSKSRLEAFYKKFDFKKKPKEDFKNRETMVRYNEAYNFEDFVEEKKSSTKSKVKKIVKKISKLSDEKKENIAQAKEFSDSPKPSGKMKSSLAKVKVQRASAEVERLNKQKEIEILKSKIRTAKEREEAAEEIGESAISQDRADLRDEDERLINIRHFHGSVQDLDDWLRAKIGETNPYKDTIMVNGPHKGQKDKSLPYQDFQNGESDLIRNRYAR
jgi:N-acetylglutamate synthase-like GNAT family acetyltransferase